MAETSLSLLEKLRLEPGNAAAWRRFDALYRPLLVTWLRRYAIQAHDLDDLLQEVFQTVVRELPRFRYDAKRGQFRSWLRAILANRLREHWRSTKKYGPSHAGTQAEDLLDQLEDPSSDLSRQWDREHDEYLTRQLLATIQGDFAPVTWEAFQRLLHGTPPSQVASDLGMSLNAVFLAKSRILKRLRNELAGFAD